MTPDRKRVLLEKLINRELTHQEEKEINDLQDIDPAFSAQIREHQKIDSILSDKDLSDFINLLETHRIKRNGSNFSLYFKIAASIAFLISLSFLLWVNLKESSKTIYSSYFYPYPSLYTYRGHSTNPLVTTAFEFYNTKNYDEAIKAFNAIPDKDGIIHFYIGVSYMGLNEFHLALTELETTKNLLDKGNPLFVETIWYTALCYISLDELDPALAQLNLIKETSDKVTKLLAELE